MRYRGEIEIFTTFLRAVHYTGRLHCDALDIAAVLTAAEESDAAPAA